MTTKTAEAAAALAATIKAVRKMGFWPQVRHWIETAHLLITYVESDMIDIGKSNVEGGS